MSQNLEGQRRQFEDFVGRAGGVTKHTLGKSASAAKKYAFISYFVVFCAEHAVVIVGQNEGFHACLWRKIWIERACVWSQTWCQIYFGDRKQRSGIAFVDIWIFA